MTERINHQIWLCRQHYKTTWGYVMSEYLGKAELNNDNLAFLVKLLDAVEVWGRNPRDMALLNQFTGARMIADMNIIRCKIEVMLKVGAK